MERIRKVRVLLVDDHLMVREGLKRLLNEQPDMEVIAEAADGPEALRLAEAHAPDVALVDVSIPGGDGVAVTHEITRICPQVRIIAVTRHDDRGFVTKMLQAGAAGYVLKQSASSELVRAVRTVSAGTQYVDPGIRSREVAITSVPPADTGDPRVGEALTQAEDEVLHLIASSLSSRSIAERMEMEPSAIETLRKSAMQKTGLQTRMQVIRYVRARGPLAD